MEDFVICQICGEKVTRIYGAHLKKHGMTSKEYKDKYPGCPLACVSDTKNTSKNSGLHMKQEKYKKMFSEKILGDKNPNHKSNTTEQERKERSPFCIEFHDNDEKSLKKFRDKALSNREFDTRLDYYIKRGFTEEESEKKLKNRQTTFTLEKCILKYGEEQGKLVYKERQQKWQKSLLLNGNLKCGFSKVSQDLFYSILEYYPIEKRKDIYFATKNQEYFLSLKGGIFFQYDFTDLNSKKMIEYNGDEYHANPIMFKENDYPHPFRKNITAQEIWNKDSDKIRTANEQGFDVLTIWDSEYKKDRNGTLNRCLDFLKNKNKI